jgi:putative DNA primase/helicase
MSLDDDDAGAVTDIVSGAATVTEDQAALRFATQYASRLAYCHTQAAWFEWSGSIWIRCKVPTAFAYARQLARELSGHVKGGAALQKLKYMNAIETLAQRDERLAKSAETWNRDPWLLGTPVGTVDLKTGKTKVSVPDDFITRTTTVAAAAWPDCPLWINFLHEATAGDEDLIRFLQQIAGYALTGSSREQALFFIYGPGGNGKGIFVNTISAIMGDYAVAAAMNTFTATKNEKHSTDVAMLAGARLVTASETAQGQRWDQQKISALTGEDTISAHFMRQDNFSFKPEFTLIIVGNYKPALASVDEAMRRRVNIIPFENRPATPDRDLFEKLRAEWPAILRWMIDGCLDWQADGLQRAGSVVQRTEQYFYDEDTIAHWLDDECEADRENTHLREASSALFKSWGDFCKRSAEPSGDAKTFKSAMEKAGFTYKRARGGVEARGVRLKVGPDPYYVD